MTTTPFECLQGHQATVAMKRLLEDRMRLVDEVFCRNGNCEFGWVDMDSLIMSPIFGVYLRVETACYEVWGRS